MGGGGGGGLCPYCLLGLLPRTAFPTLSSRKSCGFPRRQKEVEKVADFFSLASFSSRKPSKSPKGLPERGHLGLQRRERAVHSSALPPPTWPCRSPPPRGLSPVSRRGPPGSCRVKLRNVAARNVHADEAGAGRAGGGAHANRTQMSRPVAAGPLLRGASRIRAQTASAGAAWAPRPSAATGGRGGGGRGGGSGSKEEEGSLACSDADMVD